MVLDEGVVVEENSVAKEVMHKRTVKINHVDYSDFDPKGKVHIRGTKGSSIVDMYIHVEGDVIHITKPILLADIKLIIKQKVVILSLERGMVHSTL